MAGTVQAAATCTGVGILSPLIELWDNAWNGVPGPCERSIRNTQIAGDIRRAGGSEADVMYSQREQDALTAAQKNAAEQRRQDLLSLAKRTGIVLVLATVGYYAVQVYLASRRVTQ